MSCRGHLLRKRQLTIDPGTFDRLARQLVESSLLLQCPSEEKLKVPGFQFDEGKSWNHVEDHGGWRVWSTELPAKWICRPRDIGKSYAIKWLTCRVGAMNTNSYQHLKHDKICEKICRLSNLGVYCCPNFRMPMDFPLSAGGASLRRKTRSSRRGGATHGPFGHAAAATMVRGLEGSPWS